MPLRRRSTPVRRDNGLSGVFFLLLLSLLLLEENQCRVNKIEQEQRPAFVRPCAVAEDFE